MSSLTPIQKHKTVTGLVEFYQEILKPHGILSKIKNVTLKDPALQGEGAASDRRYVMVQFEDLNLDPLNLFAKMEITENSVQLEQSREMKNFEKEGIFFRQYVPAAMEFCVKKGLSATLLTDIYPKCYYGDNNMLIMENLRVGNHGLDYQILGKKEKHDMDVATFAVKVLATHHAIGYAFVKDMGGPEPFFEQFPSLDFQGVCKAAGYVSVVAQWMEVALKTNIKILEKSTLKHVNEALLALWNIRDKGPVIELCNGSFEREANELAVLTHGDYWYGNMLFLKDPFTGKVIQEKSLDFAQTLYNSPAVDLAYYMLTSVETETRQNRLTDLFQHYLSTFNSQCADLGHAINLSFDVLFEQYRKKLDFALMIAFISRYGPGQDMFKDTDLSKVGNEWGNLVSSLADKWIAENPEKTKALAKEIISVMMEYRYLTGIK